MLVKFILSAHIAKVVYLFWHKKLGSKPGYILAPKGVVKDYKKAISTEITTNEKKIAQYKMEQKVVGVFTLEYQNNLQNKINETESANVELKKDLKLLDKLE